jgi:tetratricopeptide (TPR) repeat protein
MRWHRASQGAVDYSDLLDIPRHLAALQQYDELADFAQQIAEALPGTLAVAAFLAEVRPLVPTSERAWIMVADLELQTFLSAGDLSSAARLAETIQQEVEARAAADPTNTAWQRDLSISHERLGDLAVAAGNLDTAQQRFQAALTIRERLATLDPANAQWQRDLEISRQRIVDVANARGRATTERTNDRKPRTLWAAAAGMAQKLSPWRGKLRRSDRGTGNRG